MNSSSILDRSTSSQHVYPTDIQTSTPFLNMPSNDITVNIEETRRPRVDSESSANVIKSAVLRRTNEMDDPLSLPMSGSTVSLIASPSNQTQRLYQNLDPTRTHTAKDRFADDFGYTSQILKEVSPAKSIPRYFIVYLRQILAIYVL